MIFHLDVEESRIIHIILQEDVRGACYINKMEVYGKRNVG